MPMTASWGYRPGPLPQIGAKIQRGDPVLADAEQGAGGPHLTGGNHFMAGSGILALGLLRKLP
jgi:hypothetical protein